MIDVGEDAKVIEACQDVVCPVRAIICEDDDVVEAKALFEWLCDEHPGKYEEGQLRTFQRRVSHWRAQHCEQVAILEQVHHPGEVMQTSEDQLCSMVETVTAPILVQFF